MLDSVDFLSHHSIDSSDNNKYALKLKYKWLEIRAQLIDHYLEHLYGYKSNDEQSAEKVKFKMS